MKGILKPDFEINLWSVRPIGNMGIPNQDIACKWNRAGFGLIFIFGPP